MYSASFPISLLYGAARRAKHCRRFLPPVPAFPPFFHLACQLLL